MIRMPVISGRVRVKRLYRNGWKPIRPAGTSQRIMEMDGVPDPLSIQMNDE